MRNKDLGDKVAILKKETSIKFLWHHFNLSGEPGRTCKSPFRDDQSDSFSVWSTPTGDHWKDHGTGEHGDCVHFLAKIKDVSFGIALAELVKLRNLSFPPPAPRYTVNPNGQFREPTNEECRQLGKLRGLDPCAFDLAGKLGTLKVGEHPGTNELLWWLTDATGKAHEGRTFTGEPCQDSGKKVSALNGSKKDFPVGLKTANPTYDALTNLVMVEGSADYFASLHMSIRVGLNFRTCSMLGSCCNISEEAARTLDGACVVIMSHNDEAGQNAANRWKEQLSKSTVIVQPLPDGIKDLNDMMLLPLYSKHI